VLLALAAFLFLPQAFWWLLPVEETVLLLVPALGVCFLLGWWSGGRFWLAVLWAVLAVASLLNPEWPLALGQILRGAPPPSGGPHLDLVRAWALLSAGAFGIVSMMAPSRPLLPRALSAVGLTILIAATMLLVGGRTPGEAREVFAAEYERRSAATAAELDALMRALDRPAPGSTASGGESTAVAEGTDGGGTTFRAALERSLAQQQTVARAAALAFPALLALEALAAFALAWALYHRLSRTRLGAPLAPLRDFRFNDQLVWGFVAGLVLVLLPALEGLRPLGVNLLVFFGALYALRGMGVIAWSLSQLTRARRLAGTLTVLGLVVLWWLAPLPALGLGLIDTWIDWRGRTRPIS
jgi:hypothetical protein